MKWKNKKPKLGEVRFRTLFAWFPEEIGGYTVWLERYKVKEEFLVDHDRIGWFITSRSSL